MTNGEKMQADFPDIEMWGESKDTLDYSLGGMIHRVTKSWWNAEYKEPSSSEKPNRSENPTGSDDCISREQAKAAIRDKYKDLILRVEINTILNELPAVTPQEPKYLVNESGDLVKDLVKDTISRKAVLNKIKEVCFSEEWLQFRIDYGSYGQRDFLFNYIENLPPVTPQPKTGHWIRVDKDKLRCSKCDVIHFIAQYPPGKITWCPNCGSDNGEVKE